MILNLKNLNFQAPKFEISNSYKKLQQIESVKDGSVVRLSEFLDFDFTELNAQFTSSDFSISNILAVGAQNMLNPMSPLSASAFSMSDQFNNITYESEEKNNA